MNHQTHPSFKKQFTQGLFIGVFLSVVSAVGGSLLSRNGFFVVGHDFMIASGFFVIATLVYLPIQLFNIKCPNCGKKTQTQSDEQKTRWSAQCSGCNIAWDLEIGSNHT